MDQRSSDGYLRALVEELKIVRNRGLVSIGERPIGEETIPLLLRIARTVANEQEQRSQRKVLRRLLKLSLRRLRNKDQEAAAYLFGLAEGTEGWNSSRRRTRAAEVVGYAFDTVRKPGHYEDQLLEIVAEAVHSVATSNQGILAPRAESRSYIQRPSIYSAFVSTANLAAQGNRRIFVVGDSGTGKTRLVHEIIQNSQLNPRAIWINAATKDILHSSIVQVLESSGMRTAGSDAAVLRRDFSRLLYERTDGNTIVVIDDLDDPDLLEEVLPADVPCVVIVTSRLLPSDKSWPYVLVGDMKPDEATAMVKSLLPDAGDIEASGLAISLGYRPQLIVNACQFLTKNPELTVADLSMVLAADTAAGIDAIAPRTVDALTVCYREIIEHLEARHPSSLRLLELLTFASSALVPKEYLGSFLLNKRFLTTVDAALAGIQLEAVLRPLVENCLVTVGPGVVVMPLAPQVVMQSILRHRLEAVAEAVSRLKASRGELYGEGWTYITVAGRMVCNRVLQARIEDRSTNRIEDFLKGEFASARWVHLTLQAWDRTMRLELLILALLIPKDSTLAPRANLIVKALTPEGREEARHAVRQSPLLIREDFELAIKIGELLRQRANPAVLQAAPEELLTHFMPDALQGLRRLMERYVDSPLGQLDLSVLLPDLAEVNSGEFDTFLQEIFPHLKYGKEEKSID